jgi:hypothetical protein
LFVPTPRDSAPFPEVSVAARHNNTLGPGKIMTTLRSLLEEIKGGTLTFKPLSPKEADMWDFQPIVKVLEYANSEGLLDGYLPHKETSSGNHWYDLVRVKGGLSHKGEMFLTNPNTEVEKKMESIIQLKPNIYGIGIDLKALWKRWKNRSD